MPEEMPEPPPQDAISRALDNYIDEVGEVAVSAQFDMPIEHVQERRLTSAVVRYLFARQEDLHRVEIETLKAAKQVVLPGSGVLHAPDQANPLRDARGVLTRDVLEKAERRTNDWMTPGPKKPPQKPIVNSSVM